MSHPALVGISLKPVSSILKDYEIRGHLNNEHRDVELVEAMRERSPHIVLFSLADALNHDEYISNLGEDEHIRLHYLIQELAIRAGRKEGAL